MFVIEYCTKRFGQPISIYSANHIVQFLVIKYIQTVLLTCTVFRFSCKHAGSYFRFQLFPRIHQIIISQVGIFQRSGKVIINIDFPLFRSYCCNNNHTISCTRTIHSRSSSIFQDSNALNTARIHIIQLLHTNLKTIHDKSRKIRIVLQ